MEYGQGQQKIEISKWVQKLCIDRNCVVFGFKRLKTVRSRDALLCKQMLWEKHFVLPLIKDDKAVIWSMPLHYGWHVVKPSGSLICQRVNLLANFLTFSPVCHNPNIHFLVLHLQRLDMIMKIVLLGIPFHSLDASALRKHNYYLVSPVLYFNVKFTVFCWRRSNVLKTLNVGRIGTGKWYTQTAKI